MHALKIVAEVAGGIVAVVVVLAIVVVALFARASARGDNPFQ